MKQRYSIFFLFCLFPSMILLAQTGAGLKNEERHRHYFDSIRNSNYRWTFPIFGRKLSKRGFDIPYPMGVMVNTVLVSQEVEVSDLQVGINNKQMVPLDFIEFGTVKANVQTAIVRPDLWVLPFLDIYGLAGFARAQTKVSVKAPVQFTTDADFQGYVLGFGATLAGGYHRLILISDLNLTWTQMNNIDGSTFAKNLSLRPGMNFRLPRDPAKSIAFWIGANGFFVNRVTAGTIDLANLSSNTSRNDLESISRETAPWYQSLSTDEKEVVRTLAQHSLDKMNGIGNRTLVVRYSLVKKPLSNWSMVAGGQFQFNHHWQVRMEAGFLGGKKSFMLSGNYRFR